MTPKFININFYKDNTLHELNTSKYYTYKNEYGLKLKEGDDVVVPVNIRTEFMRYSIGKVIKVFGPKEYSKYTCCPESVLSPVTAKVNISHVYDTKAKKERAIALKEEIDRQFKKKSKMAMLKQMAENDPELSKMYEELEQLSNEIDIEDI